MLGLVPPAPLNASRLLLLSLRTCPLQSAYSIASAFPVAAKTGAGGGKREGRKGTREEEFGRGKKTERPAGRHDVTSG